MKFYGNGLVWDASKNRLLCEFTKAGVLETEDTYICEKLVSLGYKHDTYLAKSEADKVVEAVHEVMVRLDTPTEAGITSTTIAVAPDQPEPMTSDPKPAEVKPKRGKK